MSAASIGWIGPTKLLRGLLEVGGELKFARAGRRLVIWGLVAGYLGYAVQDYRAWSESTVGLINSTHVGLEPQVEADCKGTGLVEIAPNADRTAMGYRCGSKLWPFYKAGESTAMMRFWRKVHGETGNEGP